MAQRDFMAQISSQLIDSKQLGVRSREGCRVCNNIGARCGLERGAVGEEKLWWKKCVTSSGNCYPTG